MKHAMTVERYLKDRGCEKRGWRYRKLIRNLMRVYEQEETDLTVMERRVLVAGGFID